MPTQQKRILECVNKNNKDEKKAKRIRISGPSRGGFELGFHGFAIECPQFRYKDAQKEVLRKRDERCSSWYTGCTIMDSILEKFGRDAILNIATEIEIELSTYVRYLPFLVGVSQYLSMVICCGDDGLNPGKDILDALDTLLERHPNIYKEMFARIGKPEYVNRRVIIGVPPVDTATLTHTNVDSANIAAEVFMKDVCPSWSK